MIFLVRHASAGDRVAWEGDDRQRPLDDRGRRQAAQLVELLAPYTIERIFSSPALRCVETVEPLSVARGLEIELRDELSEERQADDGSALVRSLGLGPTVVSCHGGLSEVVCGESQKKGEVLVLEGTRVIGRFRAKGKN